MHFKPILLASAAALGLAACGDNLAEQTFFGAGAGYVGAKAVGADPQGGAILGAAANVAYCQQYPSECD